MGTVMFRISRFKRTFSKMSRRYPPKTRTELSIQAERNEIRFRLIKKGVSIDSSSNRNEERLRVLLCVYFVRYTSVLLNTIKTRVDDAFIVKRPKIRKSRAEVSHIGNNYKSARNFTFTFPRSVCKYIQPNKAIEQH